MALGGNHATPIRNTYLWFHTELDDTWDTLIPRFLTHHFPQKSNDAVTYRSAASLFLFERHFVKSYFSVDD